MDMVTFDGVLYWRVAEVTKQGFKKFKSRHSATRDNWTFCEFKDRQLRDAISEQSVSDVTKTEIETVFRWNYSNVWNNFVKRIPNSVCDHMFTN